MFARDFFSQAKRAFEGCNEAEVLARLTDAVRLLSNKGVNDPLLGELSLCVCNGCITLPRDVGTVLAINAGGQPTLLQDQWYQYHINGPGNAGFNTCTSNSYELGMVCTFKEFSEPAYLTAEVDTAADNNKKLRVFALDTNGNKIFTTGPDGTKYEGFLVPMIFGFSQKNPNVPAISQIYRISKEVTKGFVSLFGIKATDETIQTKVGYYEPSETLPQYRRIRVGNKTSVRIKYKKQSLKLTSLNDFINIDNDEALRLACRAVKFRDDDKIIEAKAMEEEASRILAEETESKLPSGPRVPQVINTTYRDPSDAGLIYGGGFPDY